MGDRGSVCIESGRGRVYFYTHWDGSDLPETVRQALARKERWDDPEYLARIVFQQMIGDDKSATGYGIGPEEMGNEYSLLVVDCPAQVVKLDSGGTSYSFNAYVELGTASWADFD